MTYRQQLQTKEWKAFRLTILERDAHKCTVCGSDKELQVHHTYYRKTKKAWEYPDKALTTLCRACHEEEHPTLFDGEMVVTMKYKFTGDAYRFIIYIQSLKKRQKTDEVFILNFEKAMNALKLTASEVLDLLDRMIDLEMIKKVSRGKYRTKL